MAFIVTTIQYLDDYEGTSSTSFTMGTSGSQSITTDLLKAWYIGMTIELHRASNPAIYQNGTITAYDPLTWAMTFTKNSGWWTGTYSDWIVSYRRSDSLDVSQNAIVIMRMSNVTTLNSVVLATTGLFIIQPAVTTVPLVLTLRNASSRLRFEQNAISRANGNMIDFYTWDGTATQTLISGWLVAWVDIKYPSYVEVDDGITVKPWPIICTNIDGTWYTFTSTFSKSQFWSGEVGNFLFWDDVTKTLTCWDGINWNVIPNWAIVRFPSIVIHSEVNAEAYTSRAQFDTSPAWTIYMKCVNFTNSFYVVITNFAYASIDKVGVVNRISLTATSGDLDTGTDDTSSWVVSNPDPIGTTQSVGINVTNVTWRAVIKRVIGVCKASQSCNLNTITNADISQIVGISIDRTSTSTYPVWLVNIVNVDDDWNQKNIHDVTVIGGYLQPANLIWQVIQKLRHSDQVSGIASTAVTLDVIRFSNCSGIVIYDVEKLTGGVPQRNYLANFDAQSVNCVVHSVNYDASTNGNGIVSCTGENCIVANSFYTQRSGSSLTGSAAGSGSVKNVRWNQLSSINGITRGKVEFVVGSSLSSSLPNYPEFWPFSSLLDTGASPTTGFVNCGPFGAKVNRDIYDIFGSSIYTDNNGGIYIWTTGDYVIIKSYFALRWITSFQNTAITTGWFNTSGVDIDFRIANAGVGDWTTWATADGTNLSSSIASLTDFNSDEWFDMQIKLTATTDDSTRYFNKILMAVNVDPTFIPEIWFARVGVSWAVVGTRIATFTYPAGNFIGSKVLTTDEGYINCPYWFVWWKETVTMRVRKPWYAPIIFNVEYDQLGNIVPVTQVENKDITGTAIYWRGYWTTTSLIDFDTTNFRIDIWNGRVNAEDLYDKVCEYQATLDWIQAPEILTFDWRDILLDPLNAGWRFRRWHTTDTNAWLDSLPVIASDPSGSPDDEINWSVDFSAREIRTSIVISNELVNTLISAMVATPQLNNSNVVTDIKWSENKDLTQVYNNTPTIDNEAVASAVRVELTPELEKINLSLDASVSSRLSWSIYTAPDNTSIWQIKSTVNSTLDAPISSRMWTFTYTAPDNIWITNIKNKVDTLNNYDDTVLLSEINQIPTNPVLTNDSRLDNLDDTISSRASQDSVNNLDVNVDEDAIAQAINVLLSTIHWDWDWTKHSSVWIHISKDDLEKALWKLKDELITDKNKDKKLDRTSKLLDTTMKYIPKEKDKDKDNEW